VLALDLTIISPRQRCPGQSAPTQSETSKLYDPSSLVEVKTLHSLPDGVQILLGVKATGYNRIADVGEKCNPTDVVGGDEPGRCFLVGGVNESSALVAFKICGYAGQSVVAASYVRTKSAWVKVSEWDVGFPINLRELREMTSLPPEDYGPWKPK
jgi:hypothetical protein